MAGLEDEADDNSDVHESDCHGNHFEAVPLVSIFTPEAWETIVAFFVDVAEASCLIPGPVE